MASIAFVLSSSLVMSTRMVALILYLLSVARCMVDNYENTNSSSKSLHHHDPSHSHLSHHDQIRHTHHNHSGFDDSTNHSYVTDQPLQTSSTSTTSACRPDEFYDYIITGGAGFIGSNLVKRLLSVNPAYRIRVIDNLWRGSLKNLKHTNYRQDHACDYTDDV